VNAEYGVTAGSANTVLSLVKTGAATLTLSGANTYSGSTTVGGGALVVNGSLGGGTVTVAAGATLGGTGAVGGPTTIQAGGTLAPGLNGLGALTIGNALALSAGSATTLAINRTADTANYGSVAGLTSVTFGGTLTVTSLGGVFQAGDSFQLFSVGGAGNFGATNLPPISPLQWSWNPAAGTLSVVSSATVNTNPTNITASAQGGKLNLYWPPDHTGWRLLAQTNHLASGVSANPNDWATVPATTTTNQVALPLDATKPAQFYRLVYP
jgi:autotransporter-associated beta strand protein